MPSRISVTGSASWFPQGQPFSSFADLAHEIETAMPHARNEVLDGEIACLDGEGRSQFQDLLFRSRQPIFVAFDLLVRDGIDIRLDALEQRKRLLKRLLPGSRAWNSPVLFADHVEHQGVALFERACEMDLEGIVAKPKASPYAFVNERSPWVKLRNTQYSQWEGRAELFERERRNEPTPGWHSCDLACAGTSDAAHYEHMGSWTLTGPQL